MATHRTGTTAYFHTSRRIARGLSIGTTTRAPVSGWAALFLAIASLLS